MPDHDLITDVDAIADYGVSPDFYEVPAIGVRMINHRPIPVYRVADVVRLWTTDEQNGQ